MKRQQGFTLIELMIVVAIIGILAAIALPAYQDYTARSQMTEAMTLASGARTAVTEYYNSTGNFPTTNADAGLAAASSIAGNYVSSVTVGADGVITARLGTVGVSEGIRGRQIALTPETTTGSVKWTCGPTATNGVDPKFVPSSCRSS